MKLNKIENDIELGLKYKAADRLRNMINSHPDDMELWNKLAELYYDAGFFDAAGKYWIFNNSNDPKVVKCVEPYEASVNHSGSQILKEITYRGDRTNLTNYAREKLEALEKDSIEKTENIPTFKQWNENINAKKARKNNSLGCVIASIFVSALITIFIIGLREIVLWFFY